MRGALVIALCATGCFSDRGVVIEVDVGDMGVASVELFIGKEPCGSDTGPEKCTAIVPPDVTCALGDNESWFRDDVHRYMIPPQGRTATFQLTSGTATSLPIIIAVGSNASGDRVGTATLRNLVVPANTAQVATTTLVPATPVMTRPPDPQATVDRVKVWASKQGACVLVEHWKPNVVVQRDSVVPADDPDCNDGVITGSLPATSLCITPSSGSEPCTLGARLCAPDGTPGQMCAVVAKPVCVPDQLCDCPDSACILTKLMPPPITTMSSIPYINCTIPTDIGGTPCGSEPGEVSLDRFQHTCGQPLLAMTPFGGFAQSNTFSGVTIALGSSSSEQCKFTVSSGGKFNGSPDGFDNGVVKLETGTHGLLLPIHFHFQQICSGQAISCNVQDNDNTLWTCAQ